MGIRFKRVWVLTVLSMLVLAVSLVSTAGARDDGFAYGWGRTSVTCYETNSGNVFAHVSATLWVHNRGHFRHWITNMRLEARLSGGGSNLQRSWRKTRFPVHSQLLQDYNYSHALAVNTDVMNPEEEWTLEVKQVWDRGAPLADIVHHFEVPFDTSDCRKGHVRGEGPEVGIPMS